MKNKIKKYWYIILPVLLVILTELSEFLIDYLFGDRDGYISRYNIGKYLTKFQILIIIFGFIVYSFKSKKAVLINISIFIILWVILEFTFGIINNKKSPGISYFGSYKEGYFVSDSNLGYKPKPSSKVNSIKIINKDTVYNVCYTTDKYCRRVTSSVCADSLKYFAIFFGGSITFGEGVNDSETYVSRINYFMPEYKCYNYAFCGYGPNQMLAKLQDSNFPDEIKYDSGICIYTYIDEHIKRALGAMSVVSEWAKETPFFAYDKEGHIVRKGSFKADRRLKTALFRIIGSSNVIKYFNIDFPGKLKPKHYKFAADIIKESFATYKEICKNDNFYIVIFPGSENEIINYLKDTNIKIIDLSDFYSKFEYRLHKLDLHPNTKGHQIFAEELHKILITN